MNKQPCAVSFDDTRTEDFVKAAKKSAKKEANAQQRSQQILNYYRNKKG